MSVVPHAIPPDDHLADGTYMFRVEVEDLAGNRVAAQSTFVVDTLLPELCLEVASQWELDERNGGVCEA